MELYKAKALFDYEAVEETELDIKKNDIVSIEENNDSGWSLARMGNKTGWIPFDYVEKLDSEEEDIPEPEELVPLPPPVEEPEPEPEPIAPPPPEPVNSEPEPVRSERVRSLSPVRSESVGSEPVVSEPVQSEPDLGPPPAESDYMPPPPSQDIQKSRGQKDNVQDLNNTLNTLQSLSGDDGKMCHGCNKPVGISEPFVVAKEKTFHAGCFSCKECGQELGGKPFMEKDGNFYCEDCYYNAFSPKCGYCQEIIKGQYITALDQSWHPDHFLCIECGKPFEGSQFRRHDNKPYCEKCYKKLFASTCAKCDKAIMGQVFEAIDKKFHVDCFVCEKGDHPIAEGNFHFHNKKVYCPEHFAELFLQKCAACEKVISGQYIKVLGKHYHPECWVCSMCGKRITPQNCAQYKNNFYCKGCISKARMQGGPASSKTAAKPASVAKPEPKSMPVEPEEEDEGPKLVYSYEALKNRQYDVKLVERTKLEMYLADDVFEEMFNMSKAKFLKLPKWKRQAKKKTLKLW